MKTVSEKDQTKSIVLAVLATVAFGIYEATLKNAVNDMAIWFCLSYRYVFTAYIFFVLLVTLGEHHISFSPRQIDEIIWKRAGATIFYMAALAIAFLKSPSQAFVYPFFFLHPLWHEFAHRRIFKKPSENFKAQIPAFLISFSGALAFLYFSLGSDASGFIEQLKIYWPVCVGGFVAGIGFAYSNEYGSYIQKNPDNLHFKFTGPGRVENISSLRVTAYTTYAALLMLPVVIPILKFIFFKGGIDKTLALTLPQSSDIVVAFSFGCVFVAAGLLLITEAFKRSAASAKTAAVDYMILPVGFILDLLNPDTPGAAHPVGLLLSVMVIFAGALIYPFVEDKIRFRSIKKAQAKELTTLVG